MKARQIMDFPRTYCAEKHKPVALAVCEVCGKCKEATNDNR